MKLSTYDLGKKQEIKKLFTTVFSDSEGEAEGLLIGDLVLDLINTTAPQDLYGFVALDGGKIIGSIFFSRLKFEKQINAFLLSPVAVHTQFHGQGIGQKLINFGISHLKEQNVELIFTYGDPNFYAKVGFQPVLEDVIKAPLALTFPEGWLGQSLVGDEIPAIAGNSTCVAALNNPKYW